MGWPERLAAMADKLANAERTILYGAPADRSPVPEAPGPLPPELREQAEALRQATEAMIERVAGAAADAEARLERIGIVRIEPGAGSRPQVAYVDTRI